MYCVAISINQNVYEDFSIKKMFCFMKYSSTDELICFWLLMQIGRFKLFVCAKFPLKKNRIYFETIKSN